MIEMDLLDEWKGSTLRPLPSGLAFQACVQLITWTAVQCQENPGKGVGEAFSLLPLLPSGVRKDIHPGWGFQVTL